jgi:hypothetical protein
VWNRKISGVYAGRMQSRGVILGTGILLVVGLLLAAFLGSRRVTLSSSVPPAAVLAITSSIPYWLSHSASVDPDKLPLGSGSYSTTAPEPGVLYACGDARVVYNIVQTGARKFGDWVHDPTWSFAQKLRENVYVHGETYWPTAAFSVSIAGATRTLMTNDLPLYSSTGIFPTESSDPAYEYGSNPNPITAQSISISVPTNPTVQAQPSCVKFGPTLIALDGTVYYGALDSHGRDEPAYEVQDACGGLSDPHGAYHRYMPTACIPHMQERNALVGYAIDGFGVFSPYDADGRELTTKDLDECHGTTSPIMWDGRVVPLFHYVLTRDFPYSISCFRGIPQYVTFPSIWHTLVRRHSQPKPSAAAIEACRSRKISRPCVIPTENGTIDGTCQLLFGESEACCVPPLGR